VNRITLCGVEHGAVDGRSAAWGAAGVSGAGGPGPGEVHRVRRRGEARDADGLEQPSQLMLSAEDVERGYKDVSARYQVRHNDPNGYLLHLAPRIGLTRQIEVRGLATPVQLGDADLAIRQSSGGRLHDFELAFRFVLDPAVRPAATRCRSMSRSRRFEPGLRTSA